LTNQGTKEGRNVMNGGFGGMMGSMFAWMMGLGVLVWLLVVVVLVLLVVWLFQQISRGGARPAAPGNGSET
jgi:uncharacterized membrane protein